MPVRVREYLRNHHVALLALFVALGGTSYAAATGSIDTREIRNNTIRTQDVRNNTLRSSDVHDGALLAEDFKPGQLPSGPVGPDGPGGPRGPVGPMGPTGKSALFGYVRDSGSLGAASVRYGSGLIGVTDSATSGAAYTVTFNRSLVNCAVQAVAGSGNPAATPGQDTVVVPGVPDVRVSPGTAGQASVAFRNTGGTAVDTSFLVTAFC